MLAWRSLARRPASFVRPAQVCRIPRRQLNVSLPRANWQMTQPRGPGFYAQLRFRKNGTPRSLRWLLKSLFAISLFFNMRLLRFVSIYGDAYPPGYAMFLLLRIDTDYDRLNLNDPDATFDFFGRMMTSLGIEPLWVSWWLDYMKDPQIRPATIDEAARNFVENVHQILRGSGRNYDSYLKDYVKIMNLVTVTFRVIKFAEFEPEEDELERQSPAHNHPASAKDLPGLDHTPEPPAEKAASKPPPDYESIG